MRRFEYQDTKSSKFWEIDRKGTEVTVRWGRLGTGGQTRLKDLGTEAKAIAEVDKQIRNKTSKGYQETGNGAAGGVPAPTPATASAPTGPVSPSMAIAALAASAASAARASTSAPPASNRSTAAKNDLSDGEEVTVQGSGSRTYTLRNIGGVYSCTCPAWRNQSAPIDRRTCKHLRRYRGDAAETARLGSLPQRTSKPSASRSRSRGTTSSSTTTSGTSITVSAPPLLLAHRWQDQDPTGWLMSEKLDGVRAYWDGTTFLSRLGNPFFAPDFFRNGLPNIPLDGELFAGRGQFQTAVSIARRADGGVAWRDLTYVIFDAPQVPGGFEQRLAHIEQHFVANPHPHARVLDHRPCTGVADLRAELSRIEKLKGEGVMIRAAGSQYVAGRSSTLLKVKSFLDREAKVVGHQPGKGRHKGRLGALLVELPNGTPFKVGTGLSDAERQSPPKIGSIITVRYFELTNAGVPRFPVYVGVRYDVDWKKLVAAANAGG